MAQSISTISLELYQQNILQVYEMPCNSVN